MPHSTLTRPNAILGLHLLSTSKSKPLTFNPALPFQRGTQSILVEPDYIYSVPDTPIVCTWGLHLYPIPSKVFSPSKLLARLSPSKTHICLCLGYGSTHTTHYYDGKSAHQHREVLAVRDLSRAFSGKEIIRSLITLASKTEVHPTFAKALTWLN